MNCTRMEDTTAKVESLVVPRIVIAFWGAVRLCMAGWFAYELLLGFFADLSLWLAALVWICVLYLTAHGIYMLGVATIWWRLIDCKVSIRSAPQNFTPPSP